jgi:hypothetical protein
MKMGTIARRSTMTWPPYLRQSLTMPALLADQRSDQSQYLYDEENQPQQRASGTNGRRTKKGTCKTKQSTREQTAELKFAGSAP